MKNWKFGLEIISNALMIGASFLWIFVLCRAVVDDIIYWHEPSWAILTFETCLAVVIFASGITSLVLDIQKGKEPLIEYIGDALVIGTGATLTIFFTIFWVHPLYIGETMISCLIVAIALCLLVGIERLTDDAIR